MTRGYVRMKIDLKAAKYTITIIIFSLTFLLLSGCASTAELDKALKENKSLENNNKLLENRIKQIESQKSTLNSRLSETSGELTLKERDLMAKSEALEQTNMALSIKNEVLEAAINELQEKSEALQLTTRQLEIASEKLQKNRTLYNNLVVNLESELAANQIKIQEMKDGINLNLPQDILFTSGSAKLNNSGKEVLGKVSIQLKDITYKTVVVGFTDNIPIKGTLAKLYPTNWELAGARAASVVTLLEDKGVQSNKLMAVSLGESQPVATNDTPEGRSLNRRIEIRLRPDE